MDLAKLILDYIRVVAWPVVVVVGLVLFGGDISQLTRRIRTFEAGPVKAQMSGSGEEQGASSAKGGPPEMWFDLRPLALSQPNCLARARSALTDNGFARIGVNGGTTVFGYEQQYVGLIWCAESPRVALVSVSGPSSSVAAGKVSDLVRAFESRPP